MSVTVAHGSIAIPERPSIGRVSAAEEQDRAVREVAAAKGAWARRSLSDRVELLDQVIARMHRSAERWVAAECEYKGYEQGSRESGMEWFGGPVFILRTARLLRDTLRGLQGSGHPGYGPVRTRADGQATVQVFPTSVYDRLTYTGYRTDVWLDPAAQAAQLGDRVAHAYRDSQPAGEVCLVLGGGNVSAVQPDDVLHQLFAENRVVLLKCSPVQEHMGPLLEDVFRPLIEAGALRVVYGGAEVAQRLARHPLVDRLHMTGSDKTYDALVWGVGQEGELRKVGNRPLLDKPFTAELGAVTPLIVVPGPWSPGDLAFHAENAISMTVLNAGHLCVSTRLLVTHRQWAQRPAFLDRIRATLHATPAFPAYYPGAAGRHATYLEHYPHAEQFGQRHGRYLPYLFVPGVKPGPDEPALTSDPFCAVVAEAPLEAADPARFLDQAVELCNDQVWGSLSITVLVHPRTLRDPAAAAAFERALARLHYGNIIVNAISGLPYAVVSPPWGAYPGNNPRDIGSGTGFVHNTYLLDDAQKAVTHAPWRPRPKPAWFPTHRRSQEVLRRLAYLEAAPSPLKMPGLFRAALGG